MRTAPQEITPDADARDYHSIALDAATKLTLAVERSIEDGAVAGTYFEGDIFAVALEARSGPVAARIGFYPEAMFAFEHALKGALDVLFLPGADEYVDAVLERPHGAISPPSFNEIIDAAPDNTTVSVTAGDGYISWYGGRESRNAATMSATGSPTPLDR